MIEGYEDMTLAQRGATLLDAHGPGDWRERVDPGLLDMGSPSWCVLGQAYGGFTKGATALFLAAGLISHPEDRTTELVRDFGFEAPLGSYHDGTAYDILEGLRQEWRELLGAGDEDDNEEPA